MSLFLLRIISTDLDVNRSNFTLSYSEDDSCVRTWRLVVGPLFDKSVYIKDEQAHSC